LSATTPRQLIVWYAGVPWSGIAGTDRQMATALTRYTDVLWVDPPVSPLTPARFRHGASRLPIPTLKQLGPSMFRLTPQALPFHTRGALRGITAYLVRLQIRFALRHLGRVPRAVVVSHFENVLGHWPPGTSNIFFGTDDYVGGAGLMGIAKSRLEKEEKAQLRRADSIVAVSPELATRWQRLGFERPIAVVPNGVQPYPHIDTAPAVEVDLPAPIAGFVGHLSSRIDIGMLESVVAAGCSLLMVGPYNDSWERQRFQALLAHPRVKWVGPVPFEKLPGYLKVMDVGITPYADSEFNKASFPLKTLEYLAAGKPVVCTDLPAVKWLDTDLICVAGPQDFGAATLRASTTAADPQSVQRRVAFAASHSWDRRAEVFAKTIGVS
jgi:teichuronic acid biosynthesis glycosyltransferase TuaH